MELPNLLPSALNSMLIACWFIYASLNRFIRNFDRGFSILDADCTSVSRHREAMGGQVKCVICLSGIREGDEIRKPRCSHLFHRSCLDRWIEQRRVDCPLCRGPLVSVDVKEKIEEEEYSEDSTLPLLAFVQSEWWSRCVVLVEEGFDGGFPLKLL
ncbi:hypothetical protein HPP92_001702 [Vanilla planifolia]|uniref:RING-type domain-containing protein n=1 Tax=Vanilla planifolia TaxID=51239 RepID=A0A835RYQ0_VANPL|nr:hypothetical protein HPP92_001702 [Vanilla planifolia]